MTQVQPNLVSYLVSLSGFHVNSILMNEPGYTSIPTVPMCLLIQTEEAAVSMLGWGELGVGVCI